MAGRVLGVDGHRLAGARSGVGRYVAELLREWEGEDVPFDDVVVLVPEGVEPREIPGGDRFTVRSFGGSGGGRSFHWSLARAARDVDLLFCPSYAAPLAHRGPFVVTVHDALSAIDPPEPGLRQRLRHRATQASARRAAHVITVSETSRADIAGHYGVPLDRITAIPNGVASSFFEPPEAAAVAEARARHGLDGPFCLFVGKHARRRNLPTLVAGFLRVRADLGLPHVLVLAGEATRRGAVRAEPGILVLGHVPDPDLHVLYHEAEVFVYPSSYEGFGLPVLEAMAAGTPVVTARNSALAEIATDAAVLLGEPTADALASALTGLLRNEGLRRAYAELGRERAREYTWRRAAVETMAVLAAVASELP